MGRSAYPCFFAQISREGVRGVGMIYLMIRRYVFKPAVMKARENILLHSKARFGIQRDSAIVGAFIMLHVGGRFIGETFLIAAEIVEAGQEVKVDDDLMLHLTKRL